MFIGGSNQAEVSDKIHSEHCSSYNPANNNCYRDALLVSFTNCGTSMFAGVVVFSVIGFKATSTYEKCLVDRSALALINSTNLPVCDLQRELDNVINCVASHVRQFSVSMFFLMFQSASGTGLAFIIFTEAINQFPGAQLWAVLFFLMLFTLGIDSQFGMLEGLATSLVDMKLFPSLPKERIIGVIWLLPIGATFWYVFNCIVCVHRFYAYPAVAYRLYLLTVLAATSFNSWTALPAATHY